MTEYRLTEGKHWRHEGGKNPVRYVTGDTIELTKEEAASPTFEGRIVLASAPVDAEAAPLSPDEGRDPEGPGLYRLVSGTHSRWEPGQANIVRYERGSNIQLSAGEAAGETFKGRVVLVASGPEVAADDSPAVDFAGLLTGTSARQAKELIGRSETGAEVAGFLAAENDRPKPRPSVVKFAEKALAEFADAENYED